jgi:hypothetical protein
MTEKTTETPKIGSHRQSNTDLQGKAFKNRVIGVEVLYLLRITFIFIV